MTRARCLLESFSVPRRSRSSCAARPVPSARNRDLPVARVHAAEAVGGRLQALASGIGNTRRGDGLAQPAGRMVQANLGIELAVRAVVAGEFSWSRARGAEVQDESAIRRALLARLPGARGGAAIALGITAGIHVWVEARVVGTLIRRREPRIQRKVERCIRPSDPRARLDRLGARYRALIVDRGTTSVPFP